MSRAESLLRPEIAALSAYHVPPKRDLIKLDAMENPYDWPSEMMYEWQSRVAGLAVNRYPDAASGELKDALREAMGIGDEYSLLLGNGSDEIIQIIAMALARPGATILAPEPGFVMYQMIATFTGMNYVGVPLGDNFDLDMPAMRAAIEAHQPALIFLACPNNPTGNLFDQSAVAEILDIAPGLVVIDEAYQPFANYTFLPKLSDCPNAVLMRTVSKMGLAGLRLGYLIGAPCWLHQFEKLRLPYNINVLTQAAAVLALRHKAVLDEQAAQICRAREQLNADLQIFEWIHSYPSAANFILLRIDGDADQLHAHLLNDGILVKNLSGAGGVLSHCLRITVGTDTHNQQLLDSIARFRP